MAATLVAALLSASGKAGIAFTADRALNVGLFGKKTERWLIAIFATTTKAENKVKGRILLDGIILKSVAVFELLASENKTLLVWWDTLFVLDLSLDVLNAVGWLNLESNVLARKGLDEDLHEKGRPKPSSRFFSEYFAVIFLKAVR